MLYLTNAVPDCIAVRRRNSKWTTTKEITRAFLDSRSWKTTAIVSLLDIDSASYYSNLFNLSIPSFDPQKTTFANPNDAVERLETLLRLDDKVYCMLQEEHKDLAPPYSDYYDQGMIVYSGFYDQPVIDCIGYDFINQVEIENILIRNDKLDHLIGNDKLFGTNAIKKVTNSLKRLLDNGVIELCLPYDAYDLRNVETYYRFRYRFRLTGQPQEGLILQVPVTQPQNHNQMLLFQ